VDASNELLKLATAAGQALVGVMVTQAWTAARERIARMLARNRPEAEERYLARLDRDRAQLIDVDGPDRQSLANTLTAQWSGRLQDFLEENPDAIGEMRLLLSELAKSQQRQTSTNVIIHTQTATADRGGRISQTGGSQSIR
jgi:hypothetical protein